MSHIPQPGDLVARRYRWGINSHSLGLVIQRAEDPMNNLLVLWSQDVGNPTISECHHSNLIIVDEETSTHLRARCQITT